MSDRIEDSGGAPEPNHQNDFALAATIFSKFETSQRLQSAAVMHCHAVLQQAPSPQLRSLLDKLHIEALQLLSASGDSAEHRSRQEWAAAVLLGPNWQSFATLSAEDEELAARSDMVSATTSVDFYGFSVPTDRSSKNFKQVKRLQSQRGKWQLWLASQNIRQISSTYLSPTCQVSLNPAPPMSSNMRFLVRRGVPVDLRGCIWFQVSGAYVKMSKAEALRKEDELSYYQQKLHDVQALEEETVAQRDILKDIGRTWMSNVMHMDPAFRLRLKNVLMCYSVRNPQIGYCQSMNFVAALFLLFLDEERTFWLLATLVRGMSCLHANCKCG
jgi:hypothetical protein